MIAPVPTMILPRHPDRPSEMAGRRAIGYWRAIPSQERTEHKSFLAFLGVFVNALDARLPDPRDFVDEEWLKTDEPKRIARYLEKGPTLMAWMGWSNCRLCGQHNGSRCLGDDQFVWPEGFAHYVREHGVRPPKEFIDHVNAQIAARPPDPLRDQFDAAVENLVAKAKKGLP